MADTWYDVNSLYRKKITIDKDNVPSNQTNFPMLVKINDAMLRDGEHGGHVKSEFGYDISFYSETGTLLSHEIENYEKTTGAIIMWVNIPTVDSAADTEIHMYYGKNDIETDPSTTATWNTGYKMVHHCHQPNLEEFDDSTSNGNDAINDTSPGKPVTYAHPTAKIFKSVYVGEDVRWVSCGSGASIKPTVVTIETWMRFTDLYAGTFIQMPYDDGVVWNAPFVGYGLHKGGVDQFIFQGNEDINFRSTTDGVIRDINTWYHVMGTYDGTYFRLFINGVNVSTSASFPGTIRYNGLPEFIIGCRSVDSPLECFKGMLEEIRVSNEAKPTDYAVTTFNNANEPLSFYSIGAEEGRTGFIIIGTSYGVQLDYPSPGCEDAKINKQLDAFEFWSKNYDVHDDGIDTQPIQLCGIERVTDGDMSYCFPLCFPVCGDTAFYNKFKHLWIMMDRHEEVEITGLGDCYNAIYIIKDFNFHTTPRHGKHHLTWAMSLEKVRDL